MFVATLCPRRGWAIAVVCALLCESACQTGAADQHDSSGTDPSDGDDDDDDGDSTAEDNSQTTTQGEDSSHPDDHSTADSTANDETSNQDASESTASTDWPDESTTSDSSSDSTSSSDDTPGSDVCEKSNEGALPWEGNDRLDPSVLPPCNLGASSVPMFVAFGWDDNSYSGLEGSAGTGGMDWAVKLFTARTNPAGVGNTRTYDGTPTSAAFYFTATYIGSWMSESPTLVKRSWRAALDSNQEIGNHTFKHDHGAQFNAATWETEIQQCIDWIIKPFDANEVVHTPDASKGIGVERAAIFGFRTPFLEYNDETLNVVKDKQFWYDCSIEEGWQTEVDGTNFNWPYTLDGGSPGHEVLVEWELKEPITPHPGLWELPVYPYIVPPDEACEKYGVPKGLRKKLKALKDFFDEASGKITGFDYNLWSLYGMSKAEFLATLKYSYDQRLAGNRAPMMVGIHSDYYSSKYTGAPNTTAQERQEAIAEFLDYVLQNPDTRVVSPKQVLDWLRAPVGLTQK